MQLCLYLSKTSESSCEIQKSHLEGFFNLPMYNLLADTVLGFSVHLRIQGSVIQKLINVRSPLSPNV